MQLVKFHQAEMMELLATQLAKNNGMPNKQ
jgi:hypothetical protein